MAVAASALKAQQSRMRVIAENIANAQSTARTPGGDPSDGTALLRTASQASLGSAGVVVPFRYTLAPSTGKSIPVNFSSNWQPSTGWQPPRWSRSSSS